MTFTVTINSLFFNEKRVYLSVGPGVMIGAWSAVGYRRYLMVSQPPSYIISYQHNYTCIACTQWIYIYIPIYNYLAHSTRI